MMFADEEPADVIDEGEGIVGYDLVPNPPPYPMRHTLAVFEHCRVTLGGQQERSPIEAASRCKCIAYQGLAAAEGTDHVQWWQERVDFWRRMECE